eukprot:3429252-Amphidinium_carterae.1
MALYAHGNESKTTEQGSHRPSTPSLTCSSLLSQTANSGRTSICTFIITVYPMAIRLHRGTQGQGSGFHTFPFPTRLILVLGGTRVVASSLAASSLGRPSSLRLHEQKLNELVSRSTMHHKCRSNEQLLNRSNYHGTFKPHRCVIPV